MRSGGWRGSTGTTWCEHPVRGGTRHPGLFVEMGPRRAGGRGQGPCGTWGAVVLQRRRGTVSTSEGLSAEGCALGLGCVENRSRSALCVREVGKLRKPVQLGEPDVLTHVDGGPLH